MQPPITVVHYQRPKKLLPVCSFSALQSALQHSYDFSAEEELVYMDAEEEECLVDDQDSLEIALDRCPLQGLTLFLRRKNSQVRTRNRESDVVVMMSPESNKAYVFMSARMELWKIKSHLFINSSRVVLLDSDTAILTGGANHLQEVTQLSLSQMEFRRLPEMLFGHFWHGAVAVGTTVYVSGGKVDTHENPLDTCEMFVKNEWQQLPSLNIPRDSHTMVAYETTVYVVGGEDEGSCALASIEKLSGSRWVVLPVRLPEPRTMPGVVFLAATRVVVVGGMQGEEKRDSYALDICLGEVYALDPLPICARFPSNPTVSAGDVVYALNNVTATVFRLRAGEQTWSEVEVVRRNLE